MVNIPLFETAEQDGAQAGQFSTRRGDFAAVIGDGQGGRVRF